MDSFSAQPSSGYQKIHQANSVAAQIRLRARAKEASALTRLLKTEAGREFADLTSRLEVVQAQLQRERNVVLTDDPTELGMVSRASDMFSFSEAFSDVLGPGKRLKIKDVISSGRSANVDTRHQDTKDIERDCLKLGSNAKVLHGSSVGYEGCIKAIAAEVADCAGVERSDSPAIMRFARVVLNAANRTTSGGDAFEAIDRFVKAPHLVFIAPESTAAMDPISISCRLGAFHSAGSWDWGVITSTCATTRYLVYELEDVDRLRPVARIEGLCSREFGLAIPLPVYQDNRLTVDDGRSLIARSFYECDDGGNIELRGYSLR